MAGWRDQDPGAHSAVAEYFLFLVRKSLTGQETNRALITVFDSIPVCVLRRYELYQIVPSAQSSMCLSWNVRG
jgi:hypothetical protein